MARSPFMMQTPGWGASPNDGTFLDLRDRRTLRTSEQLDQVGARIIGSVLNDVEGTTGYAYYGQYTAEPSADDGASNGKGRVWGRRRDRTVS